jgi:glutamine transport system substrate-binding protein
MTTTRRLFLAGAAAGLALGAGPPRAEAAEVVVAIDPTFMPFAFKGKNGAWAGFDIDILNGLARRAGFAPKLKPMPFQEILPAVAAGKVPMAMAGITINAERYRRIDFSYPYFGAGLVVVVRKDSHIQKSEDIQGRVVGVKTDTSSQTLAEQLGAREVRRFPLIDEAYAAMLDGKIDAVIFDGPSVFFFMLTKGGEKARVLRPPLQVQSYGIAFPIGSPLRHKVDVALLGMMQDGSYQKLVDKWFGDWAN